MSVQGAMASSVSGIQNQSSALAGVSDNISNVNTIAYKKIETIFSSQTTMSGGVNSTLSPGGTQAKFFTEIGDVGTPRPSSRPTDLALGGRGFFTVKRTNEDSSANASFYTRKGDFKVDKDGFLVNSEGYFLQAWELTDGKTDFGAVKPINLSSFAAPAQQTANMELDLNLPAEDVIGTKHTIDVEIFDSLGVAHNIKLQFEKVAVAAPPAMVAGTEGAWDVSVAKISKVSDGNPSLIDPNTGDSLEPEEYLAITPGTITFDNTGRPNIDPKTVIDFTGLQSTTGGQFGATADNTITLDLGEAGKSNGATYNAASFAVRKKNQDGTAYGVYDTVTIDPDGLVTATFTNVTKRPLYQIPVATFNDPNSLQLIRGGIYVKTTQSGDALLQTPGTGQAGTTVAQALENSKVDIADEFTKMIMIQRAYSANAKMITTSSEMLEEILRVV